MTTRNLRTPALAALCAAGLLTLPAAASAASSTVVAGPLKVKDYTMTLTASDGSSDSLGVMFNRTAGKASQLHSYSFSQGVTVKTTGKSASIKADLGRYGKINLKLGGVGAAKRGIVPKGCTGTTGKSRAGTLRGSFKLVADSTYFKTVSAKTLKGQLLRGGSLKCDGAGGGHETKAPTTLSATLQEPAGMLMFTALKAADGAVTQQAMRMDTAATTAPASIMHLISAPGGAAAFAPSADLSSATGTAVSPFFTGAFSFASDMAMGSSAMGKLSGDLVAAFDSIGAQPIAAGAPDAMIVSG